MPDKAIGLMELSSIAIAHLVEDAMLEAASVELILARTICSGKFIILVGGDVANVTSSVEAGAPLAEGFLIERRIIPRVHPGVFPAIAGAVTLQPDEARAIGVVETFSASSIIDCADAAAKAADVILYRIHLAMAIGGKGYMSCTGDVAAVEAAVEAAARIASEEGILVGKAVIPSPAPELFNEFI